MLYEAKAALFWDPYKTHKCNVIDMHKFWMLDLVVRKVTGRLLKVNTTCSECKQPALYYTTSHSFWIKRTITTVTDTHNSSQTVSW
jgi:hypothetical protein